MMVLHMLSTIDNPFDPFTQFVEWQAYDHHAGYYTAEFLARVTRSSEELSDADQDIAMETAIDEIVQENILGLYRKVASKP